MRRGCKKRQKIIVKCVINRHNETEKVKRTRRRAIRAASNQQVSPVMPMNPCGAEHLPAISVKRVSFRHSKHTWWWLMSSNEPHTFVLYSIVFTWTGEGIRLSFFLFSFYFFVLILSLILYAVYYFFLLLWSPVPVLCYTSTDVMLTTSSSFSMFLLIWVCIKLTTTRYRLLVFTATTHSFYLF